MREEQRRIASNQSSVMEGRDIGTVVFTEAQVKVFLDASPEERARRRAAELGVEESGVVAREMEDRDRRDRTRAEAPLTQAPDADYLDTSGLSREEAYHLVQSHAMEVFEAGGDFAQRILADKAIAKVLSPEELHRVFSLDEALRHVDAVFERTLREGGAG